MQFPIGVFGVAIATAALPSIAASVAREDIAEFRRTLARSLALVLVLCLPSAAGLAVLGRPIVGLIFEHGKFGVADTAQTANALAAYSVGLAGYAAVKVLSPAFYAFNDARTPMLVSLGSIAVNYVGNSLLVGPLGHVGLALSTSAVALFNCAVLAVLMRRKLERLEGRWLGGIVMKIGTASGTMAAAAWLVSIGCKWFFEEHGSTLYLAQVAAGMGVSAVVFYFACRAMKVHEIDDAIGAFAGPLRRIINRIKNL
jgi:putative peptidoglycan lipid II flippase